MQYASSGYVWALHAQKLFDLSVPVTLVTSQST